MGPVVLNIPKRKLLVPGASSSKEEELRPLKMRLKVSMISSTWGQ